MEVLQYHRIRIGIREAELALSDEDRLDAFCLAIKVKLMFRASDLRFNSLNQLSKKLKTDKKMLKKYLSGAVSFGYLTEKKDEYGKTYYIANKIHDNSRYSYKVRIDEFTRINLCSLKNLVRNIVLCNHISKIEEVGNTHERATNPNTLTDMRSSKRCEGRMLSKPFNPNFMRLSYCRIMQVLHCTYYQAWNVTSKLVKKGVLRKKINVTEIGVDPNACGYSQAFRDASNTLIVISAKSKKARAVMSNSYRYLKDDIKKSNGRNDKKKLKMEEK